MTEEEAKGLRILTKMKSNYASDGDKINLRWVNGAFRLETADAISISENMARASEDEKVSLALLDQLAGQALCLWLEKRRQFCPEGNAITT